MKSVRIHMTGGEETAPPEAAEAKPVVLQPLGYMFS